MSGQNQRLLFLMLLDGVAVSLARAFIEKHAFASIGEFFESWFIHLVVVGVFAVFAGACIGHSRKFWLKGAPHAERDWTTEELLFAVLMTVLVAAVFSVIVATATPTDDFGD